MPPTTERNGGRPTVEERLGRLEAQMSNLIEALREDRLEAQRIWKHIDTFTSKLSAVGKTDWRVIFAGIALLLAILVPTASGLFGFIIYMNAQVGTMTHNVQEMKAEINKNTMSIAANSGSIEDRIIAHMMSGAHPGAILEINKLSAVVQERISEIETQFRNISDRINQETAARKMMEQILWDKIMDEPYPNSTYYPATLTPSQDSFKSIDFNAGTQHYGD